MGAYWVVVVIMSPLLIWGMISPRGQWKALSSWQFRNPEANEPSDAAFAVGRVASGIALILLIVMGVTIQNLGDNADSTPDESSYSVEDTDYLDDDYDSCDYDDPGWPNC